MRITKIKLTYPRQININDTPIMGVLKAVGDCGCKVRVPLGRGGVTNVDYSFMWDHSGCSCPGGNSKCVCPGDSERDNILKAAQHIEEMMGWLHKS